MRAGTMRAGTMRGAVLSRGDREQPCGGTGGVRLLLALALPALFCLGCERTTGGADSGAVGSTGGQIFRINAITLRGTTRDPSVVTVNAVADEDGTADQAWNTDFELSGGSGASALPVDDGSEQRHSFRITSTRSDDGEVLNKTATLTLYGAPPVDGGVEPSGDTGAGSDDRGQGKVNVGGGSSCAALPPIPSCPWLAALGLLLLLKRQRD